MKKLGVNVLVAAAMAASAAPVAAGVTTWSFGPPTACGGGNFTTCMSGSIDYSTAGTITVYMQNVAPYAGDVFTTVGLFNLPVLPTGWTADNDFDHRNGNASNGLNGLGSGLRYSVGTNGSDGLGEDGVMHMFTFTFDSSDWADVLGAIGSIGVGVHAQSGPGGCSAKVGVTNFGSTVVATAADDSCASVPEPESAALLLTGLAGLAFVASRRRNGLSLVDEHGHDVAI